MTRRKMPIDEQIVEMYLQKRMSSGDIASEVGVARGTVCKHLQRLGITRPESGTNSRNRNFKKKQFRSGYPVTFLPNHPRASKLGYVYDHILVMERKLRRVPKKTELIHHIDFDRANCDEFNLHLCKSNREHGLVHKSLEDVAKELFQSGAIGFDNGRYLVVKKELLM